MIALQCGALRLTQFYPGGAIVQIGKRHALGIVQLHAQLARLRNSPIADPYFPSS